MDNTTFLKYIDSTKALGHLLIAGLSFLNSEYLNFDLLFDEGGTRRIQMKTSDYLHQKEFFPINEFDQSSHYRFSLKPAADLLEPGNPDKDKSIILIFNTILHIQITRIFELIKTYCKETNQMDKFKQQGWYFPARLIRNCFSHDFSLRINKKDREKLPYTWEKITITEEMADRTLKFSDISIGNFTKLFDTMTHFGKQLD